MIKVEFFGNFRLNFGVAEIEIEAKNIKQMFDIISKQFPLIDRKEIKSATLFLNDKALVGVFRGRVKLKDNDKVLMLYPSSGG